MRKITNLTLVCWGTAAMLAFSGMSFAAVTANLTNGKNIFENGKPDSDVLACVTCHGDDAMGNDDLGSPRLADVGYVYIVKQLTNFANGTRKDQTMGVMNDIAKGLTEQDIRDLAAYENGDEHGQARTVELSDLQALADDDVVVGKTYKGKILVTYGVDGKAPACQSCHGANGRGADPMFPKINQQKYTYLVNQLKYWREGSRNNDPVQMGVGIMRAVAKNMTDSDINDAAAYLSQAPDSTPGNGMEVDNQTVLKNVKITR